MRISSVCSVLFLVFSTQVSALDVGGHAVYPGHPRIWFLKSDSGLANAARLIDVTDVRQLARGPNSVYFSNLSVKSGGNTNRARNARVHAFRHVVSGLDTYAMDAYIELLNIKTSFDEYEAVDIVVPAACTYDWIYNWLAKPGNEAYLAAATSKLRAIGRVAMRLGNHGPFSNITAASYRGGGLLHVGIALDDQDMTNTAYAHYRDELLSTANRVGIDGGWGEGLAYMNELYGKNMILAAELLFTATAGRLDLFTSANPFFEKYIPFTLFAIRPDFSYPRWSDIENFSPQYSHDLRENLLPLTFRFGSGLGQYLLSRLEENYGFQSMYEVLWKRETPAAVRPEDAFKTNPERSALFRGIGLAVMRTGFDSDDTYVSFKASPWLSSHVHADAGHFDIFKNGPLAIDSGSYDGWGSEHMRNYYARTVAHNTLTIYDPDESPSNFGDYVNDGGQRYWTHNVFDTYQEGVDGTAPGAPFHGGSIKNYIAHANFTYISADLTGAYGRKVSEVNRQFFFFPDKKDALIVIVDRVLLQDRRNPVSFLLHFDSNLDVSGNDFSIKSSRSTLYGRTVYPGNAVLIRRGDYEVNGRRFPPQVELPESGKGRLQIRHPRQDSNSVYFVTMLSVDQRLPDISMSENADTMNLEFTYGGIPIQIATSKRSRSTDGVVTVDGMKIALETGIVKDPYRK